MPERDSRRLGRRAMAKSAFLGGASLLLGAPSPARGGRARRRSRPPERARIWRRRVMARPTTPQLSSAPWTRPAKRVEPSLCLPGFTSAPTFECTRIPPWWAFRPGITTEGAERFCGSPVPTPSASSILREHGAPRLTASPSMARIKAKGFTEFFSTSRTTASAKTRSGSSDARWSRFTGDGVSLAHAWCFSVRHSMLAYNQGDGLRLRGWDGFLSDNWFSGNKRARFCRAR